MNQDLPGHRTRTVTAQPLPSLWRMKKGKEHDGKEGREVKHERELKEQFKGKEDNQSTAEEVVMRVRRKSQED